MPACAELAWSGVGWVGQPGLVLNVLTAADHDASLVHQLGHNLGASLTLVEEREEITHQSTRSTRAPILHPRAHKHPTPSFLPPHPPPTLRYPRAGANHASTMSLGSRGTAAWKDSGRSWTECD